MYQSKVSLERQIRYLDYLIDPNFLGVYSLFDLASENNDDQKPYV